MNSDSHRPASILSDDTKDRRLTEKSRGNAAVHMTICAYLLLHSLFLVPIPCLSGEKPVENECLCIQTALGALEGELSVERVLQSTNPYKTYEMDILKFDSILRELQDIRLIRTLSSDVENVRMFTLSSSWGQSYDSVPIGFMIVRTAEGGGPEHVFLRCAGSRWISVSYSGGEADCGVRLFYARSAQSSVVLIGQVFADDSPDLCAMGVFGRANIVKGHVDLETTERQLCTRKEKTEECGDVEYVIQWEEWNPCKK